MKSVPGEHYGNSVEANKMSGQGKEKGRGAVRPRVVWDESNLESNERNRSATMKIDEPKTPFERSLPESSEDEGDEPQKLKRHGTAVDPDALTAALEDSKRSLREGGTNSIAPPMYSHSSLGRMNSSHGGDEQGKGAESPPQRSEEEKEAFRERRKQHYMMRDQLAKQLANRGESDSESDDY